MYTNRPSYLISAKPVMLSEKYIPHNTKSVLNFSIRLMVALTC